MNITKYEYITFMMINEIKMRMLKKKISNQLHIAVLEHRLETNKKKIDLAFDEEFDYSISDAAQYYYNDSIEFNEKLLPIFDKGTQVPLEPPVLGVS